MRGFGYLFRSSLAQSFPWSTTHDLSLAFYCIPILFGYILTTWFNKVLYTTSKLEHLKTWYRKILNMQATLNFPTITKYLKISLQSCRLNNMLNFFIRPANTRPACFQWTGTIWWYRIWISIGTRSMSRVIMSLKLRSCVYYIYSIAHIRSNSTGSSVWSRILDCTNTGVISFS